MTAVDVVGLALLGVATIAVFVGAAVWAVRDHRRRERARVEQCRGH